MQKYIHYCWFGGKPLNKLAQKCLKSWKKFLPDYEIIRWDESNCDINECAFVKGAYENKKWAFVADYFRTKALMQYGGIYFDTDMEITKNVDELLSSNDTFLGMEEKNFVNAAVWYEANKNSVLTKQLLNIYKSMSFDINKINEYSIPIILNRVLTDYGLQRDSIRIQHLDNNVTIYPREYFYPLSMHRDTYVYTDNTCMVHYYDATWITKKQRLEMLMVRTIGRAKTVKVEQAYGIMKKIIRKTAYYVLYPLVIIKHQRQKRLLITPEYLENLNQTKSVINSYKNKEYIIFHNGEWLGVTSATKELFDNLVDCRELLRKNDIKLIGNEIIRNGIKQVIFSAFAIGWKDLAIFLKKSNPSIKIKVYWHGSNSQVLDEYGWQRHCEIIKLYKKGYVNAFATCKYSLLDFYKNNGIDAMFITNKVDVPSNIKIEKRKNKSEVRIGLYAAKCTDWRKNMFAQIAAVKEIKNAVLDIVPLSKEAIDFAKLINVKVEGLDYGLPREELLKRMASNDVNLYVSFSECSPMVPLESMELGVPCISGNNHHYFTGSELEKYIIVKNESDFLEIRDKINTCQKNSKKIIDLYNDFTIKNKNNSKRNVKDFLER